MFTRYYSWFIWSLLAIIIIIAGKGILMAPHDISTLTTTTFAGHEWQYNIYRLVAMSDAFSEGMPGRWIDNFSFGWGYPLFQYTGPVPYTFGALLLNIGFDPAASLNASWFIAYVAAGLTMFFSTRNILGNWGALVASACYLLAPYHLVDTYVRTNLVETTAFIFPPLILGALWLAEKKPQKAVLLGAVGVMFLPLTHMLSTYLIGLGLIVFTLSYLALLPVNKRFQTLRGAILIATIGLALSAFFWIPALVDIGAVRGMGAITEGFYSYDKHFVYPEQLVSSEWHYGGSEEGPRDYISFSLGKITLFTALLALAASAICLIRFNLIAKALPQSVKHAQLESSQPLLALVIASAIAATAMIYMTVDSSTWLWRILPSVDAVQFPWRFLFPASFFLAICAGSLPKLLLLLMPRYKLLVPISACVIAFSVIINHWDFARAGSYQSIADVELTDHHHKNSGVWTTNNFEFMPTQVTEIPHANNVSARFIQFYAQAAFPEERIISASMGHGWATIQLSPGSAGELELRQHWHPAWQASIDGIDAETFANPHHPLSPLRIVVPESAQEVSFRYGYTPSGKIGLWVSLLTLLIGLWFIIKSKQYDLLVGYKLPALLFLAILIFYYQTAQPDSRDSNQRLADIELRVSLADVSKEKISGSRWNAAGNIVMSTQGMLVEMGELKHQPTLSLSLDHNDRYLIGLLKDNQLIKYLPTGIINGQGGLATHQLAVPNEIQQSGYDAIAIIPLGGDGYYSLGHLLLLDDEVKTPSTKTLNNSYLTPERTKIPINHVANFRPTGTAWNAPGNVVFSEFGLQVDIDYLSKAKQFDISLDSNDSYIAYFFNNEERLATLVIPKSQRRISGLIARRFTIPDIAQTKGFNRIGLVPQLGDNYFSLGHLILLGE